MVACPETPAWAEAAIVGVGVALILTLVRRLVVRRLRTTAARTASTADDLVADVADRTAAWFPLVTGLAAAAGYYEPARTGRPLAPKSS
ncbi:MAG: hypothetical protein R2882_11900 [Gemmatimonadales bacterium]